MHVFYFIPAISFICIRNRRIISSLTVDMFHSVENVFYGIIIMKIYIILFI